MRRHAHLALVGALAALPAGSALAQAERPRAGEILRQPPAAASRPAPERGGRPAGAVVGQPGTIAVQLSKAECEGLGGVATRHHGCDWGEGLMCRRADQNGVIIYVGCINEPDE